MNRTHLIIQEIDINIVPGKNTIAQTKQFVFPGNMKRVNSAIITVVNMKSDDTSNVAVPSGMFNIEISGEKYCPDGLIPVQCFERMYGITREDSKIALNHELKGSFAYQIQLEDKGLSAYSGSYTLRVEFECDEGEKKS